MKCIFLDIDGTIFDHDIGIQASTIQAIQEARKKGHKVCIATGRAKPEVDDSILQIGFDGFLYACGALVETPNKTLAKTHMEREDIYQILTLLQTNHIGFNLEGLYTSFLDETAYSFFHTIFQKEQEMNSELVRQYMASVKMRPFSSMKAEDYEQIVKVSTFAHDANAYTNLRQHLPPHLKFIQHHAIEASLINGEIMYDTMSKAVGMKHLLDNFHIPREHSIASGDSMNDKDMLQFAHIGIAMGNACPALKDVCDDETTSSKHDGIYQAFKKHNLI